MSREKKNIIIDVERMKYPNTGLHNYCSNLMNYISRTPDFNFTFFTHKKVVMPSSVNRMNRKIINKLYLKPSSKYDLWHGTFQNTKFLPKKPIKFVLTIHDLNFLHEEKSTEKRLKLLKEVQKRIDAADYITTISEFALNDVKKNLNIANKKTKVIYNGVNLVRYPDFSQPKYKPQKQFLFALGTVLPKKNFHELVKLIANTPYELIIGGIHPCSEYLHKMCSEVNKYNAKDRVKLLGAITEKEKFWYMNNCTAFLFPSLAEGFGLPVIEAMQLGKPVFLSTYTSLPEIGGKYAYYFNSFDIDSMKQTLIEGINDYHSNHRKEAIINWGNQFNWEKAAKEYNDVYKEVLFK